MDSATRPTQAFFQEAWPAQPQGADVGSSDSRGAEGVPAAIRWMHRLGDFLRSHSVMETFTTMTRQRMVTPAAGGGSFILQKQGCNGLLRLRHPVLAYTWKRLPVSELERSSFLGMRTRHCLGGARQGGWRTGPIKRRCCMARPLDLQSVMTFRPTRSPMKWWRPSATGTTELATRHDGAA